MNITPIFIKKVISEADIEVWNQLRKHYLPPEYHSVFQYIDKYLSDNGRLPTFDALKLSIRSDALLNKVHAILLAEDVDIQTSELLEYIKNDCAQEEIIKGVSQFLDSSVMLSTAKESLDSLKDMIAYVESRVDTLDPEEDISKMDLFRSEEDLANDFTLGLNAEFDKMIQFAPQDYILIGGVRGTGKSLTCSNITTSIYDNLNRSSIYFTIEMPSRAILQRNCAKSTKVSYSKLKSKNLSVEEWVKVAKWWSGRFTDGDIALGNYMKHREFSKLHAELSSRPLNPDKQMDIIYDPNLTISTIRNELVKKVDVLKPAVVIVDYVNQVGRFNGGNSKQFDWTEQIKVSKALKGLAQEFNVPIVSPYQIDASGEARFAKGLLDSADAAFLIQANPKKDSSMTFKCVKMRDNTDDIEFTSQVQWDCLKIGPASAEPPSQPDDNTKKRTNNTNNIEEANDL